MNSTHTTNGTDNPAERATRVARVRSEIDAGIWVVIWLSLAFTAINVQIFAARGAEIWSLAWCAAWLLDPMVSILVLVVVRAEQITSRWQVTLGWPITATKWGCFAATYAMNTWSSWVERSPSMIVLHSVPPAMMLLAAEVGPRIRDGLTRAVMAASAEIARTPGAVADLVPGDGSTPRAPGPHGETDDVAPDGARGLDRTVPPVGSGPGRAPDPETVEVEAPTADAAAGSGPDRFGHPSTAQPTAGSDDAHDADADAGCGVVGPPDEDLGAEGLADPRVRLLRELLDSECAVTGPQAAALLTHEHGTTSDRTARRLLAEARRAHPSGTGPVESGPARRDVRTPDTDTTHIDDRDDRERTGTDGAPTPSTLSLVPRPPRPTPGDPS